MMLQDQVYAQAALLAGELEDTEADMLKVLCRSAAASLSARLREGLTPEDCKVDFIASASLLALAALNECGSRGKLEQISAGDLTVRSRGADAASRCLRNQAELIMGPYLVERFSFRGV